MEEELKSLLLKTYSNGSNEEKIEATEQLTQIYADPSFLLQFIEIFMNPSENPSLRQSAIISFGKNVKKSWSSIVGSDLSQQVKSLILEFFSQEHDKLLLFNCVHAIEFIFSKEQWLEVIDFITQLRSEKEDPVKLELALYLCQYLIIKLDPSIFEANQDSFVELAREGFNTDNLDTIVHTCGLSSVLIYCTKSRENEQIGELFTLMMQAFHNSISDINIASRISARISYSFQAEDFHIPAPELLQQMLELVQQEGLDQSMYVVIFMLIEDLIGKCGKQIHEQLSAIIEVCLKATASVFIPDATMDLQDDFLYMPGAIEMSCMSIRNRHFFDILFGLISAETTEIADIAAGTYAFYRCIEHMSEGIMKNIETVTQFLIERLSVENECVQEIVAMSMEEVGKLIQEGQDQIGNLMIEALIQAITQEFDESATSFISHCLDALAKLMETSNIEHDFIQPLLTRLVEFIENDILTSATYNVLTYLVFSAGNMISEFSEALFPVIVAGAQVDEEENPILKQNALEALGQLFRFSGSDSIDECMELFIQSYSTDDLEIRSSVIVAIKNLMLVQTVNLEPYKEQIIAIVNTALQFYEETSPEGNGEEEEIDDIEEEDSEKIEKYPGEIRYIDDAVLMIKHIFKFCPALIPEDLEPWATECIKMMDCGNEDIQASSTQASMYIWVYLVQHGASPEPIFQAAMKNLEEAGGPNVLGAAFKLFAHFFEQGIVPEKEMFDAIIRSANQRTDMDYGDEMGQDELDLSANLYRLWAIIATKFPQDFPVNQFLDQGKRIMKSGGNFEKSQYLGVLRQLYFTGLQFPDLVNRIILKMFFENIDICDFSVIPEPILFLNKLLEVNPEVVFPHIEDIVSQVTEMLDVEYDGEIHFYTTVTDCVSFLCTLMKKSPQDFAYEELLPLMINALPVRGDEIEAEHIYSSLLSALQTVEQVQAMSQDLLIAFAKTLALTDQQLESYQLSPQTKAGLIQVVKQFASQDGAAELIAQNIDENSQEILSQRLA